VPGSGGLQYLNVHATFCEKETRCQDDDLVSLIYVRKEIWSLPRTVLTTVYIPNVNVQWVTLLLRVQEMPGSTLGLKTGYAD
jgi:hypothetical protein